MLQVNVGLSRKLTRDYNSHGFSINLEGEVAVDRNDPDGVVERIQELYDLTEEALLRQIERHESDTAIASRDEQPAPPPETVRNGKRRPSKQPPAEPAAEQTPARPPTGGDLATNKQIQFLLSLGKRQGLGKPALENRIEEILGQRVGVYDLTKRDAGTVLDTLTAEGQTAAGRH